VLGAPITLTSITSWGLPPCLRPVGTATQLPTYVASHRGRPGGLAAFAWPRLCPGAGADTSNHGRFSSRTCGDRRLPCRPSVPLVGRNRRPARQRAARAPRPSAQEVPVLRREDGALRSASGRCEVISMAGGNKRHRPGLLAFVRPLRRCPLGSVPPIKTGDSRHSRDPEPAILYERNHPRRPRPSPRGAKFAPCGASSKGQLCSPPLTCRANGEPAARSPSWSRCPSREHTMFSIACGERIIRPNGSVLRCYVAWHSALGAATRG